MKHIGAAMSGESIGEAPAAVLEELLGSDAAELGGGANQPIRLEGPRAWLVTAGQVEVFAIGDLGGGVDSARSHIVTAEAGCMLFGIDARRLETPAGAGRLIAVAHPDARILATSTSALTRLARDPANVPALESAIDGWVAGLFHRLPRQAPPARFATLRPGAEVRMDGDSGGVARCPEGVVWVRHVAGESRFLGRRELAVTASDRLLPISEATWLAGAGETVLSCIATGRLLRGGLLWAGLDHLHDLFLRHQELELEETAAADRRNLEQRRDLDQQTLSAAHARLASVLGDVRASKISVGEAAQVPFFTACQLVARHQGIELRSLPSDAQSDLQTGDPEHLIQRIGDASRVRYRRILLRDTWWRQDVGPIVAFHLQTSPPEEPGGEPELTSRPVALLPTSPSSYEMFDTATQARTPVDDEVAESLSPDGYVFYPALPERPVRFPDLVRLAFQGRRRELLSILLMGLGGGVLALFTPLVTEQLFGRVIPSADRSQLLEMILALVVAALGATAFQVTRSIAVLRLTGKIDGSLQAAVWDRLLSLPNVFFRRFTVGDLADRAMGIDAIRDLLVGNVTSSFLGLVFSVFSFALLFYYSPRLALLATGIIGVLVVVTALFAYLQLRHQRVLLAIQGKIASLVFGLINGIGKLRTSAAEKRAYAVWAEQFTAQRQRAYRAERLANAQETFSSLYDVASYLALFAVMGLALESDLSVSRFLAFSAAFGQVQASTLTFVSLISGVLTMVPIYERLSPILAEVPEVDGTKLEAGKLAGDVEFAHVNFRYHDDSPLVLTDVSLRASPGQFVALVGPSGSGKSTCLRLLLGFEQPRTGSIYFDGQDLASLDLKSVRRQIGVVLQNSRPMAGDIFRNIVGTADLGVDTAWEAARMAGLAKDIEAMPMGMHTVISEGGGGFSGGQIQRLMIARAIVGRPRILMFDEATSALDNRNQRTVAESLERLEATRIIVAHRLSTIENADYIYVFDAGRIVEQGTYQELIAKNGLFMRLAERQIA